MFLFRGKDDVFEPPSRLELVLCAPLKTLIKILYRISNRLRSSPAPKDPRVRVVCISDTHTQTYNVPSGDVLIHAGDLTNDGTIAELQNQIDWLSSLPHKYKIAIAGNHDTWLDPRSRATLQRSDREGSLDWKGIKYLQHSSTTLSFYSEHGTRKLNVYGAPQIPACGGPEAAFQYQRGQDAWSDTIPSNTDILVTHTPPKYHRDILAPSIGCEHLLQEVWRVKPTLHVFGHVHVGAGKEIVRWDEVQKAYEAGVGRKSDGLVREMIDLFSWIAAAKVLLFGASGFLWDRIWGGEQQSTIMVNSALMVNNSGKLGNKVQVVDI